MLEIPTMPRCKHRLFKSLKTNYFWPHNGLHSITRPCDSEFDLILQFAGKNFTLSKTDILVPSYLAVDSLGLGGEAFEQCQFQAQPDDPTEDEFGPFTSITYQFGDPLLRNIAMVCYVGPLHPALFAASEASRFSCTFIHYRCSTTETFKIQQLQPLVWASPRGKLPEENYFLEEGEDQIRVLHCSRWRHIAMMHMETSSKMMDNVYRLCKRYNEQGYCLQKRGGACDYLKNASNAAEP